MKKDNNRILVNKIHQTTIPLNISKVIIKKNIEIQRINHQ